MALLSNILSIPRALRLFVPRAKFRENVEVTGSLNGINLVYTIPDKAVHDPPRLQVKVYRNGQRLLPGPANDYEVSESGGVGTGFDTITLTSDPPLPGESLWADYVVL